MLDPPFALADTSLPPPLVCLERTYEFSLVLRRTFEMEKQLIEKLETETDGAAK